VGHVVLDDLRAQAERIFGEWQEKRRRELVDETLNQARGHARGVTGLRRVLRSLELGEVQTLLLGENYTAQAVECSGCGHLDAHIVSYCPICGRVTRNVVDVSEAILPLAIGHDIELFYLKDDPEFDRVGNIAALLRYRSDQSAGVKSIAAVPRKPPPGARSSSNFGRWQGLAGR
jgi:peptide subunit release factor 1 (eRF1)